ncbi:IBR domain protein (macronuclear) [Tetrahymena thermophila SB210]|uniref:IBR domain protein n=1 Tax=Tetrahymena thermophila (strain SB210) TaxID=312017 RepID=Q231U3_TETTS|nr:IBR domain protein [Tetrahymena thermophila SB210]EAR91357.2 IBR domain protein [Tetrahymena thermophila SB210]|eukprot:XP_001011602.2 IBR domain protein [Tetrahymena thermophila SB210]
MINIIYPNSQLKLVALYLFFKINSKSLKQILLFQLLLHLKVSTNQIKSGSRFDIRSNLFLVFSFLVSQKRKKSELHDFLLNSTKKLLIKLQFQKIKKIISKIRKERNLFNQDRNIKYFKMSSFQSIQKLKVSEIQELLAPLSSINVDKDLLVFIIGTQYAYKKINKDQLNEFVTQIIQLYQQCKSKGQYLIIEQVFSQLIDGEEQEPLSFIKYQYDSNFKQMNLNSQSKPLREQQDDKIEESKEEQKSEIWNCDICFEKMTDQDYWPIECCHNTYHRVCLKKYFNSQVEERRFPIKCVNNKCPQVVSQQDIREILNDSDFQKYSYFQIKNYIEKQGDQASWCLTPDCQYAFILENNQKRLDCPFCKKSYLPNLQLDLSQKFDLQRKQNSEQLFRRRCKILKISQRLKIQVMQLMQNVG